MEHQRITCDQVQVGDHVARARTHRFQEVVAISEGPVARRLVFPGGDNIRPRRTAKLWLELTDPRDLAIDGDKTRLAPGEKAVA